MPRAPAVYLLPAFPVLFESFVAGEVLRLARLGVELRLVVLDRSDTADPKMLERVGAAGMEPLYLMDRPARLMGWAAAFAARHPGDAVRAWRVNRQASSFAAGSRSVRLLKTLATMRLAEREGWHHVHAHWTLPADVGLMLARIRGLRFSFSAHAVDIYDDPSLTDSALADWGLPGKIASADFVATCTGQNREVLSALAPDGPETVKLIYHGVDLEVFDGAKVEEADTPAILSVGRLVPKKGFLHLIEACDALARDGLRFRCEIVGEGRQRPELEAEIRRRGLEDAVALVGGLPQDEVRDRLRRATVFVLCPDADAGHYGIPNVLFESLAMRTPAVSRHLPGIEELVSDGENGLVVHDPAELAPAMRRLLEDPELRARLGQAGRETVERRFDADATAAELRALLMPGSQTAPGTDRAPARPSAPR